MSVQGGRAVSLQHEVGKVAFDEHACLMNLSHRAASYNLKLDVG